MTVDRDVHARPAIVEATRDLALAGFRGPAQPEAGSSPAFAALRAAGSELWLDTGDPKAASPLWARELTGLTTNNTLVNPFPGLPDARVITKIEGTSEFHTILAGRSYYLLGLFRIRA